MSPVIENVISKAIVESINKNSETIRNELMQDITSEMDAETFVTQAIYNSIRISVDMSVKTIMEILVSQGLVQFSDEKQIRSLLLTPVE